MKLVDKFKQKKTVISVEVFPPRAEVPIETALETLGSFAELNLDFMSVTYGAGGSLKGRTVEIASKIKNTYGIECMSHFTSVGHSIEEVNAVLKELKDNNIENILALRGDAPVNQPDFDFSKNVFQYATEVVAHAKASTDFCVAAAAYPEGHIDAKKIKTDLIHLKDKVDKGVDFLVTQLFFDNRTFYCFMDLIASMGITCPVTAGVMPIFKADQVKRIASLCGASMPGKLIVMLDKYHDNPEDLAKAGIEYASNQVRDLVENGVDGVHLLTMNRPKATREIMTNAGLI